MSQVSSVKEYFDTLDQRFNAEAAKGMKTVFQYEIDGGDTYHVELDDGSMKVNQGASDAAEATLKMKEDDFVSMVNGKLNGQMAFMTGKLKMSGNIQIAMKLQNIFPPAK